VVRLEKELPDEHIRLLNGKFADLIKTGKMAKTTALPEESDEPDLLTKPRITLSYNKKSAGRLNKMILEINRLGREG
jgi:hypothetical protein